MTKDPKMDHLTAVAMRELRCHGPVVSEGLMEGEKFCSTHGNANDIGYGWGKHGCKFARKMAVALAMGDAKKLGKLVRWVSSP